MAIGATGYKYFTNDASDVGSERSSGLETFSPGYFKVVDSEQVTVLTDSYFRRLSEIEPQIDQAYLLHVSDREIGNLTESLASLGFTSAFPSICHGERWGMAHWDISGLADSLNCDLELDSPEDNFWSKHFRRILPMLVDPRLHVRIYQTEDPKIHVLTCHIDMPGFGHFNPLAHLRHEVNMLHDEAYEVMDQILAGMTFR